MPKKHPTLSDLLTNANADFVRLNPHLAPAGGAGVFRPPSGRAPATPKAHKESTRLEKCNKTESRFYREVLSRTPGDVVILPQPPRFFELPCGDTYPPDFLVLTSSGPIYSCEVKGGYRGPGWEQGYERYQRAAAQWDGFGFRFLMAEWCAKDQTWRLAVWDRGPAPAWWSYETIMAQEEVTK